MNLSNSGIPGPGAGLAQFPLLSSLRSRRSRRFGLGMKIPGGPLAYESRHPPAPLTEDEEAALVFAACGITGNALADLCYSREGGGNIMAGLVARTIASGDGLQTVALVITNDEATYLIHLPASRFARGGKSPGWLEYGLAKGRSRSYIVGYGSRSRTDDLRLRRPLCSTSTPTTGPRTRRAPATSCRSMILRSSCMLQRAARASSMSTRARSSWMSATVFDPPVWRGLDEAEAAILTTIRTRAGLSRSGKSSNSCRNSSRWSRG